jgi:hypothetical protein
MISGIVEASAGGALDPFVLEPSNSTSAGQSQQEGRQGNGADDPSNG